MTDKIDSNITGLAYAEESAVIGVLPGVAGADAIWRAMEPNSYADMGSDIKTMARTPINPSRQRKKGATVDLDASVGFNHDFLQKAFTRPAQSFFFAAAREKANTQTLAGVTVALTSATNTTYVAAAGLGVFKIKDLVLAEGFGNASNNGLKLLSAVSGTTLTTTGNAVEAGPPAAAKIRTVGVQFATADVDMVKTATALTLTSVVYDFTTLGLIPGEWVYLGSDTGSQRFANNQGYARLLSAAAHALVFDQSTFAGASEAGTAKDIRMFFGTALKNEATSALIVQKPLQFERQLGEDADGVMSEYVIGTVGNELTLNMPQADKLTVDMSFVGIDGEQRTGDDGIKVGTRVAAVAEDAYNTSSDFYRLYLNVLDPTALNPAALFGYVQDGKLTIGNGITPNKALGVLGAFALSAGDFMVGGSLTAYFTTVEAVAAIRDNADIGFNVIGAKENAGFVFDIPLMSISGGKLKVEKDQPIMIPLENTGFENPLGYTLMYCNFAYLPDTAMPA